MIDSLSIRLHQHAVNAKKWRKAMWRGSDVRSMAKALNPSSIRLWAQSRWSIQASSVDDRSDSGMIVYKPVDPAVADRIPSLLRNSDERDR